jgi:CRISPR system Cascade subunit CasA
VTVFNLLDEKWIPVRRRSGLLDNIAPWQIAESTDPPLHIESPRPDFDGALIQFLIGLVQTAAAPASARDWRKAFDTRPDPQELRDKFNQHKDAFNLDGPGPRFMQDLTLTREEGVDMPVAALLIESPGEKTVEDNSDLFIKRDLIPAVGLPAAAMALFTLQSNAPSGGQGHRTSLRGGGPLSTVVLGDELWRTVWLNVLTTQRFLARGGKPELDRPESIFPWMALTRTSEMDKSTTPEDVHPAQQYWAMPRRVRLHFLDTPVMGRCSITAAQGVPVISSYSAKNYGVKYEGAWSHPLTPYRIKEGSLPNPKKIKGDGLPYRDWPQMVLGDESQQPAAVVRAYFEERRFERESCQRLWAFGFEMDNMKARCWHAAHTPLVATEFPDTTVLHEFTALVNALVGASEEVRDTLLKQIKNALFRRRPKKVDLSHVSQHYWGETTTAFFDSIVQIRDGLQTHSDTTPVRERWLHVLHGAARLVFESHSQLRAEFATTDVERVARAWNELLKWTDPTCPALRKILSLSTPSRRPTRRARQKG